MHGGSDSPGLASLDPYEIDDAPSPLSDYSSCNDSEFEKYCSANSVMGTPSICSSFGDCNEFLDIESESLRNALDGENKIKENSLVSGHARDGKNYRLYDRVDTRNFRISGSKDFSQGVSSAVPYGREMGSFSAATENEVTEQIFMEESKLPLRMVERHNSSTSFSDKSPSPGDSYDGEIDEIQESPNCVATEKRSSSISTLSGSSLSRSSLLKLDEKDGSHGIIVDGPLSGKGKEGLQTDDEHSSEYGSSDVEDSNLDSGTDDEKRVFVHGRDDFPLHEENTNPLLMNSVVAFGSDDWNEFVLETGDSDPFSARGMDPLQMMESGLGILSEETKENDTFHDQFGFSIMNESRQSGNTREQVRVIPFVSSSVHCVDGDPCSHQDTSTPTSTSQNGAHANFQMDSQSCLDGNVSIEGGSQSCKPIPEVSIADDLGSVRSAFSPKDHHLDHVEVAEKMVQCISDEELGSYNEISANQFSHSMISLGSSPPYVKVSEPTTDELTAPNETQQEKKLPIHGTHEFSDSTIIMEELKPKSEQCLHVNNLGLNEASRFDVNGFYDDMVQDMEAVLLESVEPHGAIFSQVGHGVLSHQSQPCRDGSSTASTSGAIDLYPPKQYPNKIDWIEVVGAKQKRGEVSFGERLVGVKEYTVYIIRVWSGDNQWEVERRYRDFFTLYRQLKIFFTDHGLILPSPWINVERESRKIFGNASPDVISQRSALIQECLWTILYTETHVGIPNSLVWFLSKENTSAVPLLSTLTSLCSNNLGSDQGTSFYGDAYIAGVSSLGKTISLVVEMHPKKSIKQFLEAQHYKCAGCYKHLDVRKSLVQEFAQTLGWRKPRLCEYTGQLFCSTCHSNDTAVLPARVLQHWDFSLCPVSQLAKAYLDSIYDQPMLCVSAVNPYLFSKVPPLLHIMGIRKKIAAMLECVRCPFSRSIQRSLGCRKYLLENNDFFALRDLVDLSKGAFAALPVMMDTLSRRTLEHITQQCLVCCDVGELCGARLACDDPSSLIFPFQESEMAHCSSCGSVFHNHCFEKLRSCPCSIAAADLKPIMDSLEDQRHESGNEFGSISALSPSNKDSRSAANALSNLLSKIRLENPWRARSDPVILMGSLSSLPT